MNNLLEIGKLALLSGFGWFILAVYFLVAEKWPRLLFVISHYTLSILTFVLIGWIYAKYWHTGVISPFRGMITCMVVLFSIEIVFF